MFLFIFIPTSILCELVVAGILYALTLISYSINFDWIAVSVIAGIISIIISIIGFINIVD